jgi:phosphatidylglycerophosphate synthase
MRVSEQVRTAAGTTVPGWEMYARQWARRHGGYDPLTAGLLARGWLRFAYATGRPLARVGVSPDLVTFLGLLCSLAVPLVAVDNPAGAAGLVVLSAALDSVDGAVAMLRGRANALGQVYDAVADRLAEACWLVALWRLGAADWLVLSGGALCWLHEYLRARARAAGLGGVGTGTVAERPTRILVMAIGLLLTGVSGLLDPELVAGTATATGAIFALLSLVGFGQLFWTVRRKLHR